MIDAEEVKIGPTATAEALRQARELGLDLVEVAPNAKPPVCRIMDYGKFKYQQQKKDDKARAGHRGGQLKELKIQTVRIGDHDLEIKINHAMGFLKEGNKVQFTLQFRGREMAHIDLGYGLFRKVKAGLLAVCKVERDAKMEGRRMTMVLQPEMKTDKKPGGGAPKAPGLRPAAPQNAGAGLNIQPPRVPQPFIPLSQRQPQPQPETASPAPAVAKSGT